MSEIPSPIPQPVQPGGVTSQFLTPTNAILFLIIAFVAYRRLFPSLVPAAIKPIVRDEPILFKTYTRRELQKYNGIGGERILMGIRGNVYDVTAGAGFYGPDGPYGNFAGNDASRGLAKGSFDKEMLTPVDQPVDDLNDLTEDEQRALTDWEDHFRTKYFYVGKLEE